MCNTHDEYGPEDIYAFETEAEALAFLLSRYSQSRMDKTLLMDEGGVREAMNDAKAFPNACRSVEDAWGSWQVTYLKPSHSP